MLFWLSEAAKTARGESRRDWISALADVDPRTVRRFEEGKHWPRELDEILHAYATIAGLDDVRQLWQAALELWYEHGEAPLISRREDAARGQATEAQRQFRERLARQAPRSPAPAPAAERSNTSASRKRRASGK